MLSPGGALGVLRMVEIVDELKAKLVEIDGKMEELRCEIVVLDDQKTAFETVIRVYDPGFERVAPPSKARRASSRETASGRVTELLNGKNNRHIVLDILRRLTSAARTIWIAAIVGPAEIDEETVGIVLGERPDLFRIEIAAIRTQHRMLSKAFLWVRPGATVVFRTSGLLKRKGRRCSASGWEFASGACSNFRSIRGI